MCLLVCFFMLQLHTAKVKALAMRAHHQPTMEEVLRLSMAMVTILKWIIQVSALKEKHLLCKISQRLPYSYLDSWTAWSWWEPCPACSLCFLVMILCGSEAWPACLCSLWRWSSILRKMRRPTGRTFLILYHKSLTMVSSAEGKSFGCMVPSHLLPLVTKQTVSEIKF